MTTLMFVCQDKDDLYFVLVDKDKEKAIEVVQGVSNDLGLLNWEYAHLDDELMKKFDGHEREILYRATNGD